MGQVSAMSDTPPSLTEGLKKQSGTIVGVWIQRENGGQNYSTGESVNMLLNATIWPCMVVSSHIIIK